MSETSGGAKKMHLKRAQWSGAYPYGSAWPVRAMQRSELREMHYFAEHRKEVVWRRCNCVLCIKYALVPVPYRFTKKRSGVERRSETYWGW